MKNKNEIDYFAAALVFIAFIAVYFPAFEFYSKKEYYLHNANSTASILAIAITVLVLFLYEIVKRIMKKREK